MLKNLLITTYRNLLRNKSNSIINLTGLTLGITCCIIIFFVVRHELSFDTFHKKGDRIFRITTHLLNEENAHNPGAPYPVGEAVLNEFPEVEQVSTVYYDNDGIIKANEEIYKEEGITFVAPSFFELFDFEWISGDPKSSLEEPYTVVLTESVAQRYFGGEGNGIAEAAVGKTIKLNDREEYKVTGIMKDFPENTDFPFKILMSYATRKSLGGGELTDWISLFSSVNHFALLKEGTDAQQVEAKLPLVIQKNMPAEEWNKRAYLLQPLSEIHFDDRYGNYNLRTPTKTSILSLSLIGFFLLLTACINFINLATAQSMKRTKEVGVRKVLGAGQMQIIRQFMFETFLLALIGLGTAIAITEYFFPSILKILDLEISFNWITDPVIPLFLVGIIVFVSFFAGFYPALVLSNFQPVHALKNKFNLKSSRGFSMRRGLIIFQFVISQILIISTIVVAKQLDYFRSQPLGYDKEAIVTVALPNEEVTKLHSLRDNFKQIAGIEKVSLGLFSPSSRGNWQGGFNFSGSGSDDFTVVMRPADPDYISTFGLTLLAGRDIKATDSLFTSIVVNENLLHIMNIRDPHDAIGKTISVFGDETMIVGVVKDFYAFSLHEKIQPVIIFNDPERIGFAALKVQTGNIKGIIDQAQTAFEAHFPESIFEYQFLDETIAKLYQDEEKLSQIFTIFSGIAIFIGCLGLYGLISFMAVQKTKEIGVRKVLGASLFQIVFLFIKEFMVLILIAFAISAPVGWYIMQNWLQDFENRIPLGPGIFILAIGFTLLIAAITVCYQTIKAAMTNPVKSLKID